ncbi:Cerevisin [Arthrobotrys entomopaga]|nr:Cerevisin [Arthrobotrys entomopaga]
MKRDDRQYFRDISEKSVWISQKNAPWHLQRVSCSLQVNLTGRAPTDLNYVYRYEQLAGQGVDVYVVDSGINVDHEDFGGRAQMIFSYFGKSEDDVGHGTHTAGTIGSLHYGVAKNVNLWGIKVGDKDGINGAAIVAGIDAAITKHNQRKKLPGFQGSIISMSMGTTPPARSDYLVLKRALDAGMHASVAAMNSNADACESSPGAFSQQLPLINVGALDLNDTRAGFSNYGKCVDVYAPGVSIVSTSNNNSTAIMSMDGTSMACPIVTGMIADELVKHPDLRLNPTAMKAHILEKALKGVIKLSVNMTGTEGLVNNGFRSEPKLKPADEKPSNEKSSDEKPLDETSSDEKPSDKKILDEKLSDEKPSDEDPSDEEPLDEPLFVWGKQWWI